MLQKPLKIIVTFIVIALMLLGIYSLFTIYFSGILPENKVIYLKTQQARGRVIKMTGNKVTLEKDGSTLGIVIPSETPILRNSLPTTSQNQTTGSAAPVDDPTFVQKASLEDIKVGTDLFVSFKWMNGKYIVESALIVN